MKNGALQETDTLSGIPKTSEQAEKKFTDMKLLNRPKIHDGVMRLSPAQLSALLEGIDWARVHGRRVPRPTATQ